MLIFWDFVIVTRPFRIHMLDLLRWALVILINWLLLDLQDVIILDRNIAWIMLLSNRIIVVNLFLAHIWSWFMLTQNLRWTLSRLNLILLNHEAYLHLHLFVILWIWCKYRFIYCEHCGVRIESLKIYDFLNFCFLRSANLIRFYKTLFMTDWKRHFFVWVILKLHLKLITKRVCRPMFVAKPLFN